MTPTVQLPSHIDSTMISCFRSCPQKFYNEFILGLRPARVSVDLHAGACFATALETLYKLIYTDGLSLETALPRTYAVYLKAWGDFEPMTDTPKTRERVWEAVENYISTYSPLTDSVQPYRAADTSVPSYEFTFAIPLSDERFPRHPSGAPFLYAGRFDMLGIWNDKVVVRDEKTTKSIASAWAEQWDLRSQFLGYCWACQQSGLTVDTVVVRGVGILKTKITQIEAVKTYSQHLISRWYDQLCRDLWRIRRAWDENYFDYNLADACTAYGGCVFRDLCSSPAPARWHSQFTIHHWNPLLKNPIAEQEAAL